ATGASVPFVVHECLPSGVSLSAATAAGFDVRSYEGKSNASIPQSSALMSHKGREPQLDQIVHLIARNWLVEHGRCAREYATRVASRHTHNHDWRVAENFISAK